MNSLFVLTLYVTVLINANICIPLGMFYPYGDFYGDGQLQKNDDESSAEIHISTAFQFFNESHRSLFVNTNGDLTFISALPSFTPESFPFQQNASIIATYWADVDTRTVGDVWYRETNNTTLLLRVSSEIQSTFPQQSKFNASWIFITTWDNVGFYGADEVGQTKRCSFQCILATDGRYSFVVFNYNLTQWTTGTASGGNSSNGVGGTPAQVGFDAGDGIHFYAVPGSQTPGIINITQMSNVGIPGKFIFRVDLATIERATSNTVVLSPMTTSAQQQTASKTAPTTATTSTQKQTVKAAAVSTVRGVSNTGMRIASSCFGNPCQNGTCIPFGNRFVCLCDPGYEGRFCQIDTNACAKEPCQYGYCVDQVNDFVCKCGTFFQGKRCMHLKTLAITSIIVAIVVLYLMSCYFCIFTCKQQHRDDAKVKSTVGELPQKPKPSQAGKPNAWMFV